MNTQHTPGPWNVTQVETDSGNTGFTFAAPALDSDANAALIAAAPELLAALRELTNVLMEQQDELAAASIACVPEIENARAAIAKAEGK